jgi:hypothetical protein
MDEVKALSIVSALANGVNPQTGEVFPDDSPYQTAEIVRALFVAARALQSQPSTRRRPDTPANAGKPWSENEDAELLKAFDRGVTIPNLAQAHGRTPVGIQARLEKHGRVPPQDNRPSQRARAPATDADQSGRVISQGRAPRR